MGLLSRLRRSGSGQPAKRPRAAQQDRAYGTGVWRQHRDRFNRAVDRFYQTALAVREEARADDPQQEEAAEALAALTYDLNALGERIDETARRAHAQVPVADMVVPAQVRAVVGDLAEGMSKAALLVAQAAQAAAMSRAAIRMGTDPREAARAAGSYVRDAQRAVERLEERG